VQLENTVLREVLVTHRKEVVRYTGENCLQRSFRLFVHGTRVPSRPWLPH